MKIREEVLDNLVEVIGSQAGPKNHPTRVVSFQINAPGFEGGRGGAEGVREVCRVVQGRGCLEAVRDRDRRR